MERKKLLPFVYYALLFALGVCLLALGIADTRNTGDRYSPSPDFDVERAFAHDVALASRSHFAGSVEQEENKNYILSEIAKLNGIASEQVSVKYHKVLYDGGEKEVRDPYTIANIYVRIPGNQSEDTLVIMGHYDSVKMGPGAGDNSSSVACMLEMLRQISDRKLSFGNQLLFFFTDGEERALDGSTAALKEGDLSGYDIKLAANFECRGTGGTQIMFETGKDNYRLISELKKVRGGFYTNSIANFVYNHMTNYTDLTPFLEQGIAGLNFANIGEGYNYHTQNDNTENLDKSYLAQVGAAMGGTLEHFGNLELDSLYQAEGNAVFFNYLDWFTISYPLAAATVLGGVMLAIFACVLLVGFRRKTYSPAKFGVGAAVTGIALVLTLLVLLLVGFVLKLFGVYGGMVNSGLYNSVPLFLAVIFIACTVSLLTYHFLGRLLKTDARHVTLAGTAFLTVVAAALAFVLPELSFLVMWTALFAELGCLAHAIFGAKGSLDTVNLPLIGLILTLPIVVGVLILAGDALGAAMYPYIGVLISLFLTLAVPQMDGFKVKFKKFSLNRMAVVGLTSLVAVALLLSDGITTPARNLSANLSGHRTEYYDDTLVFVRNQDAKESFAYLYDYDVYPYLRKGVGELSKISRGGGARERRLADAADFTSTVDLACRRVETEGRTVFSFTLSGLGREIDARHQAIFTLPVYDGIPLYVKIDGEEGYEGDGVRYTGKNPSLDVRLSYDCTVIVTYEGSVERESVFYREIFWGWSAVERRFGDTPEFAAAKALEGDGLRALAELQRVIAVQNA